MARPTKLTPETQAAIVEAIDLGMTYELAAMAGGVSDDTFRNWLRRGDAEQTRRNNGGRPRASEEPFFGFFRAVKKAEATAAARWLKRIDTASAQGEWQAAAWKLERRYPQQYGRKALEVTGRDSGPVVLKIVYDDDRISNPPAAAARETS